ncbi:disintegrin and metalloproteinase domain-containing protein 10 [Lepeophtheirus salmonis]|uniref:Disintegrin and metalloproteinase domaincontaining protein 10like [Oreochromis niloticus] n=1 Tax=Lepeophtheirus salmonis TaxID=72036 RepID=A0A0K2VGG9_LEPSM|nr:disintegrin and metalloproteinase domain-containing protein 10-like [Lepeophtheirus salmonis]
MSYTLITFGHIIILFLTLYSTTIQALQKIEQFNKYIVLTSAQHVIVSQSDSNLILNITTTNDNYYELRLHKEENSFNFEMDYYVGFVVTRNRDMKEGHAYGVLNEKGFFRGTFEVNDDKYYIEDAKRYLDNVGKDVVGFLYKSSDVHNIENELNDEFKMDRPPSEVSTRFGDQFIENGPYCVLNIEVDKSLYYSFDRNIQDIKQFVFMTVMGTNKIYREADLVTIDGHPIQFVVGRLQVNTPQSCNSTGRRSYRCSNEKSSVEPKIFIEDFSFAPAPHTDYCLSYVFSAQNFGATLGIAYVGGVCEPQIIDGDRNYNVGFITTGGFRTQYQTELTLAHEFGHSLGSAHDSFGDGCLDPQYMEYPGYNLMSPIAPKVEKKNSRRFSPCSKKEIDQVLMEMKHSVRRNCLVKEPAPLITSIEEQKEERGGAAGPSSSVILSIFMCGILLTSCSVIY